MGKYDSLGVFLRRFARRNKAKNVTLSYSHIEKIIGADLPRGADEPVWWETGDQSDMSAPHRQVLHTAGFEALADPSTQSVTFRRCSPG